MTDTPANLPQLAQVGYHLTDDTGEVVTVLPLPKALGEMIQGHVERDVQRHRAALATRGGMIGPHDLFEPMRHVQEAVELAADYASSFKRLADRLTQLLEELAADAVGADNDGKPVKGLTVPDADGDIKVTPGFRNTYSIQPQQVLPAFAAMFAEAHVDAVTQRHLNALAQDTPADVYRAEIGAAIAEAITEALLAAEQLGKFELQVSKVRAYADDLSRNGHDSAASVVASAIHKDRSYAGLKVERKK